jgi:hypothetical protein
MSTDDVELYTEALAQIHDDTGCGRCKSTADGAIECEDEVTFEPLTFPAYRNEQGYGDGDNLHHCYNETTVKDWIKAKVDIGQIPTDPFTQAQWKLPNELIPMLAEVTGDQDNEDGSDDESYESEEPELDEDGCEEDGSNPVTIQEMMDDDMLTKLVFNIWDIYKLAAFGEHDLARDLFDYTIRFPIHDVRGESYQGFNHNSFGVLQTCGMYSRADRYFSATLASSTEFSVDAILCLMLANRAFQAARLFHQTLGFAKTFDVGAIIKLHSGSVPLALELFLKTVPMVNQFDVDAIIKLHSGSPPLAVELFQKTVPMNYLQMFDPEGIVNLKRCGMVAQATELFRATISHTSVPNNSYRSFSNIMILKAAGMGDQATELFNKLMMYMTPAFNTNKSYFSYYEDLSVELNRVGMHNEGYQVMRAYHDRVSVSRDITSTPSGTQGYPGMFAEFEEDEDEYELVHDAADYVVR